MDFEFTEDQRAIAEMAGSVFADYCTDDRLRQFDTCEQAYMQPLWQLCVETGLQALAILKLRGQRAGHDRADAGVAGAGRGPGQGRGGVTSWRPRPWRSLPRPLCRRGPSKPRRAGRC